MRFLLHRLVRFWSIGFVKTKNATQPKRKNCPDRLWFLQSADDFAFADVRTWVCVSHDLCSLRLGARDFLRERGWTCVAGILSPVADNFAKPELIDAPKRLRMCELAVETSDWLRASGWECAKTHWSRTLDVLDHHKTEVEKEFGSDAHLMMICGADLLDSFNTIKPDGSRLWELEHLKRILRDYGVVVLERENAIPEETLRKLPLDEKQNVMIVRDETFPNQLSSTRLRAALRRGHSIRYCTPDAVNNFIREHNLYA